MQEEELDSCRANRRAKAGGGMRVAGRNPSGFPTGAEAGRAAAAGKETSSLFHIFDSAHLRYWSGGLEAYEEGERGTVSTVSESRGGADVGDCL